MAFTNMPEDRTFMTAFGLTRRSTKPCQMAVLSHFKAMNEGPESGSQF